jgi:hypothetical protein
MGTEWRRERAYQPALRHAGHASLDPSDFEQAVTGAFAPTGDAARGTHGGA